MQLIIKRPKIFMLGNKRFVAEVSSLKPVPSWCAETDTYKNGVKDGSIVNLTERAKAQEAELAAEEDREPEPIIEPEVPEQDASVTLPEPAPPQGLQSSTQQRRKR